MNPLFSFGTSRGGTTFFARILSNSPDINMASDPFLPIYRNIRNHAMKSLVGSIFDSSSPLCDYYFDSYKMFEKYAIENFNMRDKFPVVELDMLREQVKNRTYKDLFDSAIRMLVDAYGNDAQWIGANDNWALEFLPLLASIYPNAKFIIMIRDPRGSFASSRKVKETRPELVPLSLSFLRHVRKHMDYAIHFKQNSGLSERVFLLRYEDLALHPSESITEICDFLHISYNDIMLDTDKFRPVSGSKWSKYSHFDVPEKGIYTESIDGWKERIPSYLIELTEFICGQEMNYFGYDGDVYSNGDCLSKSALDFLYEDEQKSLGWRNKYSDWNYEVSKDLLRYKILSMENDDLSNNILESNYLFKDVHDVLHEHFKVIP